MTASAGSFLFPDHLGCLDTVGKSGFAAKRADIACPVGLCLFVPVALVGPIAPLALYRYEHAQRLPDHLLGHDDGLYAHKIATFELLVHGPQLVCETKPHHASVHVLKGTAVIAQE